MNINSFLISDEMKAWGLPVYLYHQLGGAGKSTVLNMLGGMDKPTEGQVFVGGQEAADLGAEPLALGDRRAPWHTPRAGAAAGYDGFKRRSGGLALLYQPGDLCYRCGICNGCFGNRGLYVPAADKEDRYG